jgi:hypothetical protein
MHPHTQTHTQLLSHLSNTDLEGVPGRWAAACVHGESSAAWSRCPRPGRHTPPPHPAGNSHSAACTWGDLSSCVLAGTHSSVETKISDWSMISSVRTKNHFWSMIRISLLFHMEKHVVTQDEQLLQWRRKSNPLPFDPWSLPTALSFMTSMCNLCNHASGYCFKVTNM